MDTMFLCTLLSQVCKYKQAYGEVSGEGVLSLSS